jgi:hypothetical protein
MEAADRTRRARFDAFEVDMRSGEVRKHGIRLKLHGQPFQVLSLLLEHPGDLVTRAELRQKLWPGETFVDFDTGLNSAVKKLRNALCESAEYLLHDLLVHIEESPKSFLVPRRRGGSFWREGSPAKAQSIFSSSRPCKNR